MNKTMIDAILRTIFIIIIVFLGITSFSSNFANMISDLSFIDNAIENQTYMLERFQQARKEINNELDVLPETPRKKTCLLHPGQEGKLMKHFLKEDIKPYFEFASYDLYSPYKVKPENSVQEMTNVQVTQQNLAEKMNLIDENTGMPLTNYQDEAQDEWAGLEVVPIKLTFTSKKDKMKDILQYFWEKLPYNLVRSSDFIIDNDTITGTIVFTFPLNEK